jgi:pyrroline-5-carboxylate reductase
MKPQIGLVGGGRMGGAMLRGWAETGVGVDVTLFEPNPTLEIAEIVGAQGWRLNPDPLLVGVLDAVVVAVKPQSFSLVCDQTIKLLVAPHTLVVSVMAGLSVTKIMDICGAEKVIRAMPNTPGQIGRGITAYFADNKVSSDQEALAVSLLSPLGKVEKLSTEKQMDAVTAVSGSGPAYVFLMAEALAAAGESEGLERSLAERLAYETVIGSAALMEQSGQTPLELRRAVTSPEGTTAAALDVLTAGGGLVTMIRRAVEAAAQRSRQLGR